MRLLLLAILPAVLAAGDDDPVVFKSDVSLVRVDVRVSGTDGRAIPHLSAKDFVLRDNGQVQEIKNFASEEMPLDVLFLIDVSGSMQAHVERLANASKAALNTLAVNDRVGVMVFDRRTRVRVGLTNNLESVERDLRGIIRSEGFNGGTDITRAMYDAAKYMGQHGRKEARRAIVILTDDETELDRDDLGVEAALKNADTVMSALIAPDAMMSRGGYPGGGYPGGGYPGGGQRRYPPRGGWGGVILPPIPIPGGGGGGYPGGGSGRGGGYPGGGPVGGRRTQSAGTSEIARASGGDSLPVDHASALQDTLDGLRQRYSLYFSVPPGARAGQVRRLSVQLSSAAARRVPGAQLAFRDDYEAPATKAGPESPETVTVSQTAGASAAAAGAAADPQQEAVPAAPKLRRRSAGESYGSHGPNPNVGWGTADAEGKTAGFSTAGPASGSGAATTTSTSPTAAGKTQDASGSGGWRKATSDDLEPPAPPKAPATKKE
ncbi:MAG: VWA domain-containing protein [Acidobacteria bacterium]|nr:VWA domain-containing protein [Acidobacteriota bacterium]